MPSWLANFGEDPSLAILREESRREAAAARREAEDAETLRQEKALEYRRQLEREAEERKEVNRLRREAEENESDSDSEDDEAFQKSLADAKARQAAIIKGSEHPPTMTNTKLKKPVKSISK